MEWRPTPRGVIESALPTVGVFVLAAMWERLRPNDWPGIRDYLPFLAMFVLGLIALYIFGAISRSRNVGSVSTAVDATAASKAQLDERTRDLVEWDTQCRRDWWIFHRVFVEIERVTLAGVWNTNAQKIDVSVQFFNLLTGSLKIMNLVGNSSLSLQWDESNEAGALITRSVKSGEPRRFNAVSVWYGSQSSV
ncbi:MAG: hypothetical protein EXR65_03230 [Dehalococcoidia bacterium]|nr:hypothetical protein [Dehalococcoidia bacterium]